MYTTYAHVGSQPKGSKLKKATKKGTNVQYTNNVHVHSWLHAHV